MEWQQAGGIVGRVDAGMVKDCQNSGGILAKGTTARSIAGGIVGIVIGTGQVEECYNIGKVESYQTEYGVDVAGGIAGANQSILKYSYSNAQIEGECVGGILGQNYDLDTVMIEKCYYSGELTKGIGTEESDVVGKTEKVSDNLLTFDAFLSWIGGKK